MSGSAEQFFSELPNKIDPSKLTGVNASFQFAITGEGGGDWHVKITDGEPEVGRGQIENPDITLTASDSDWMAIVNGELSGQDAFLTGKLRIEGDMSLALKLQTFLP